MLRSLRNLRLARNPEREPRAAASVWYSRMTRALAHAARSLAETPDLDEIGEH